MHVLHNIETKMSLNAYSWISTLYQEEDNFVLYFALNSP